MGVLLLGLECMPPSDRHPQADNPPPPRRPLHRTERILLECILVLNLKLQVINMVLKDSSLFYAEELGILYIM